MELQTGRPSARSGVGKLTPSAPPPPPLHDLSPFGDPFLDQFGRVICVSFGIPE